MTTDKARTGTTLAETMAPAALLLGGVPMLTMLVMVAVRYVADGTF
jgi:hypothetical protein